MTAVTKSAPMIMPSSSIIYGKPGMGKTSAMSAILANSNYMMSLDIAYEEHVERQLPDVHDPNLTAIEHMGLGIGNAAKHLTASDASILGHIYHELRSMGATCQLVRVKFKRHIPLPGQGRNKHGAHRIKSTHMDLLVFQWGVVDWMGNTWKNVDAAVAVSAGVPQKKMVIGKVPRGEIKEAHNQCVMRAMLGSRWEANARLARDELELAWLEAQTPQVVADKPKPRL